jgi:8-oxo-dGTP diphosphatase
VPLKFLLIKRNITPQKNKWSLPGGFVNVDENIEDAALRKFVEETGIAPAYLSQVRTYSDVKRDKREIGKDKVRVITTSFIGVYTFDKDPGFN